MKKLTYRLEGCNLGLRGSLAAGDDGTGVPHPTAGGRRHARNEGHHRLGIGSLQQNESTIRLRT